MTASMLCKFFKTSFSKVFKYGQTQRIIQIKCCESQRQFVPKIMKRYFSEERAHTCSKRKLGTSIPVMLALFGLKLGQSTEEKLLAELEPMEVLTHYVKLAKVATLNQEYLEADQHYHTALRLASQLLKEGKITEKENIQTMTYCFDGLANMAASKGELEKAVELFKETLKGLLQTGVEKEANSIMEISIKLATLYTLMGKTFEAQVGFENVIKNQEQKMKTIKESSDDQDEDLVIDTEGILGAALEAYGRFLMGQKQFDKAIASFQRCDVIAKHILGEENPQRLVVLNDLAAAYILKKNLKEAEKVLNEVLLISEGQDLPEVCAVHCNLGAVSLRQNHFDQAEKHCKTALTMAKRIKNTEAEKQAEFCLTRAKQGKVESKSS